MKKLSTFLSLAIAATILSGCYVSPYGYGGYRCPPPIQKPDPIEIKVDMLPLKVELEKKKEKEPEPCKPVCKPICPY